MIENEFEYFEGAVAKATRKRDPGFVIHSLDHGVGILSFGAEVVKQKVLMFAQHFGDLGHRRETRAHGSGCPGFEICRRPGGTSVLPEVPEAFLEFPCTGGCSESREHGFEFVPGLAAHFGAAPQQEEPTAFGLFARGLVFQPGLFPTAHGVHRLVEVFGNVKRIKHVEGLPATVGDDFQERFPHVGTNDAQTGEEPGVKAFETIQTLAQGGLGAALADPEQPARAVVDLIDKGQEVEGLLATAVMEFIDADGGDAGQVPVFEAPFDHPLDRAAHGVPTGGEDCGRFLPRQSSGPAGEENHVGLGVWAFAAVPRHGLYGRRSKHRANHPAWHVVQVNRNIPKRHVMPSAFGKLVVDASGFAAAGAAALATRVGVENHLDARIGLIQAVADGLQNKAGEVLHAAKKCFNGELNGGCGVVCCFANPSNARGRHSQVHSSEKNQRVLPRKTHSGLFAEPAAAVKRADDINPAKTPQAEHVLSFMPSARLTAARSEHSTPATQLTSTQNQHKFYGRTVLSMPSQDLLEF